MSAQGPVGAPETAALTAHGSPSRAQASAWPHAPTLVAPAATLPRLRAYAGQLGLVGLLSTTLLVALAAAKTNVLLPDSVRLGFQATGSLAGPFGSTGIGLSAGVLIAVLALMFASYAITVTHTERISPRAVLMCIAALNALILLAPPLLSTDIFSYQFYGRMGSLYGANPYFAGPHALALDSLYPYIGAKWWNTPTVYGPLFTLLSYALTPLSIAASAFAYKSIAVLASLGTIALLWHAARLRGVDQVRAVALFGLNPLIVLYGVGGGHNDLLMLLPLMAGIYLLLAKHERSGSAMAVVAAGIKITALLPLAFAVAGRGGRRDRNRRSDVLIGAGAALIALAGLGFAVFGTGPLRMFATLAKVQSEGDWHSIPGFIGTRLGLGTVGHVTGILLGVAFVAVLCALLLRTWQGRIDWIAASGWTAVALLVTASSLLPWYVAWLMPLAALGGDRRLWRTAIVLTGVIQGIQLIGYIPHGVTLGL
jgi:alpha-1,6-mannosyltransferase